MAFIPVGDTWRVKIHYRDNAGNDALNVIYVRDDLADFSLGRAAVLAAELVDWLTVEWAPAASTAWGARRLEIQDMNTEFGVYLDQAITVSGTNIDPPAPSETTVAISLRTGRAGRSYRGRLYHVGLGDGAYIGDYMSPVSITSLIGVYEALIPILVAQDFTWCVCSFVENGAPRAAGFITPITTITITDNIVDSMRSRKPRP